MPKKKFTEYMIKVSLFGFRFSFYSMIILFLLGGAFASIMLLVRLYPADVEAIMAFIILSESFAKVSIFLLLLSCIFIVANKLIRWGKKNGS